MENCVLISYYSYCEKNGQVYRNYVVVYNGVFTPVKLDTNIDFIKDNIKRCPCISDKDYKKILKNELTIESAKTVTYKEFVASCSLR